VSRRLDNVSFPFRVVAAELKSTPRRNVLVAETSPRCEIASSGAYGPREHVCLCGQIRGEAVIALGGAGVHHRPMPVTSGMSSWACADDGVELHERSWLVRKPRAVLVFLHGIASHGGWFTETAGDLAAQGVAVVAPDRRGSGLSRGPRGHLPSVEQAISDIDGTIRRAHLADPNVPVYLAASSWAAKLGVAYVASRPNPLAGLVLLGPGLFPVVRLSLLRRAQVLADHRLAPTVAIPIPLTPEQYTTNPTYLDFIRGDPLRLLTATSRFYWETRRLDRRRRAASTRLTVPLLVLQGGADAMVSPVRTRRWFDRLAVADKTYRAFPGAGHTLDFEPERGAYLDELRSWLCRR
jgi:acylglycerol lipase